MATLTAGNSVTLTLGAFDSVTCNGGQGLLTLTSVYQDLMSSHSEKLDNKTFGPYGAPQSVVLSVASGVCTYTLNTDPSSLTTAQAAGVPTLSFRDSGGIAVPISSFDGAGISGKFGLSLPMLIPANTLVAGQSRIRISVTQRKVGAANCFLQVHLGSANSTGDPAIAASQISTAGTTPVPSVLTASVSISSDGAYCNYLHARTNVGVTTGEGNVTSGINLAVDNYLNFVITGSAAATVNALLGYEVEVFR